MSVKVVMKPASVIEMNLGLEPNGPAHKHFAERCKDRMNARYVPEKTGVLHDTSYIDYNDCSIHYDQQYAGYQYYGQRKDGSHKIVNHNKSGTGPYWDKLMLSAEGKDLEKDMQNYISKKGK